MFKLSDEETKYLRTQARQIAEDWKGQDLTNVAFDLLMKKKYIEYLKYKIRNLEHESGCSFTHEFMTK